MGEKEERTKDSKHKRVKERDTIKEHAFKDAYHLPVKIETTEYNDKDWNWDLVVLNFKDSLGKNYGLVEFFKPGNDNSTDHVNLEYEDHKGNFVVERYDTFNKAEKAMVELMNKRKSGLNGSHT